tara:strand:+ start:18 stop:536 length:519 start_codon:yes stop_codon:yes gene_type:complete
MTNFIIVCALEQELPPEKNPYIDKTYYTGMGMLNASLKVAELIHQLSPDLVVNYGTCGACNLNLSGLIECGIISNRHAYATLDFNSEIILSKDKNKLSSGDDFVTRTLSNVDVVDMEGYAIAYTCQKYSTKFKCYKYITDYVSFSGYAEWNKNVSDGYPSFLQTFDNYLGEK